MDENSTNYFSNFYFTTHIRSCSPDKIDLENRLLIWGPCFLNSKVKKIIYPIVKTVVIIRNLRFHTTVYVKDHLLILMFWFFHRFLLNSSLFKAKSFPKLKDFFLNSRNFLLKLRVSEIFTNIVSNIKDAFIPPTCLFIGIQVIYRWKKLYQLLYIPWLPAALDTWWIQPWSLSLGLWPMENVPASLRDSRMA